MEHLAHVWHRSRVDVDAFSSLRSPRWERLTKLARARRRTGAEVDEMTVLYRSTAADLSTVRSVAPEPALVTRLSILLAQSRVWLTGDHQVRTADVSRYFSTTLPASMFQARWWGASVALTVVALATVAGIYTYNSPDALNLVGPFETRQAIAEEEFASYYTEYDSSSFTARVWTNNAWLAVQCIAFGFTGIYPAILMYNTVFQLGVAGAVMAEFGALDIFFQLISPHGLLELSAVFVAAGAGFKVFWAIIVPQRNLPRGQTVARAFRTMLSVALGLAITLLISGLFEGFVTPSGLPWPVKVAIGTVGFIAFWMYIFVVGRIAHRKADGDVLGAFATETARALG